MSRVVEQLPSLPGSYALILALEAPCKIRVGRLGDREFAAPFYLYAGSALGPGGLAGRLAHHLRPATRPHWHIDSLRGRAPIVELWTVTDARRFECAFASAARRLRGARVVSGFGASDCACEGHLIALTAPPTRRRLRHHLRLAPDLAAAPCPPIRRFLPGRHERPRPVRSSNG